MNPNYDSFLFVEIIESIQGIVFLREDTREGFTVRFYQGLKGNLVMIDMGYEDLIPGIGKDYLHQLGLEHLIPSLFPDPAKKVPIANQVTDSNK